MKLSALTISSAALLVATSAFAQTNQIIYSNAVGGDAVSYTAANQGTVLLGTQGWNYANLQSGAITGIDGTNPDPNVSPDNGSLHFQTTSTTGKGDIQYTAALGTLADFSDLSYDWYRSTSDTAGDSVAPAIRLQLIDNSGHYRQLVYEPYQNGSGTVTKGAWVHEQITLNSLFWISNDPNQQHLSTLSDWLAGSGYSAAVNSSSKFYGLTLGAGSGWSGNFEGWADNVTLGVDGKNTTYNFETQAAPEPASLIPLVAGALGLIRKRKTSIR